MHPAEFPILRLLCIAAAGGLTATAGPLFPCVRAVSSPNGNFLVVVDTALEPRKISLNIFPRENFNNETQQLLATTTHWTDSASWAVILDPAHIHNEPECPLPLITDDGEFLILLQTGPAFAQDAVVRIYRRRDHPGSALGEWPDHGVFIKGVALATLWSPAQLAEVGELWSDGTPEWFAGGTFKFSSDSRLLIHKTRWHSTVRIKLEDGSTLKE